MSYIVKFKRIIDSGPNKGLGLSLSKAFDSKEEAADWIAAWDGRCQRATFEGQPVWTKIEVNSPITIR